jgi:orotate phosphoribosyltransferase
VELKGKQLKAEEVIQRFKDRGALLEGHFILTSGMHSDTYLQCALVLEHPADAESLGRALAEPFQGQGIETVASPAIGGIIIGYEVARALGARFIWTERDQGKMILRRGFTVNPGERVIVIEDVITTGGSTLETIEALRASGGKLVGAGSIIDRSAGGADVSVPRVALATLNVASVDPALCDACARGEAAIKPGSRKPDVSC